MDSYLHCDADELEVIPAGEVLHRSPQHGVQSSLAYASTLVDCIKARYGRLAFKPENEDAAYHRSIEMVLRACLEAPLLLKGTSGRFRYALITQGILSQGVICVVLRNDRYDTYHISDNGYDRDAVRSFIDGTLLSYARTIQKAPIEDRVLEARIIDAMAKLPSVTNDNLPRLLTRHFTLYGNDEKSKLVYGEIYDDVYRAGSFDDFHHCNSEPSPDDISPGMEWSCNEVSSYEPPVTPAWYAFRQRLIKMLYAIRRGRVMTEGLMFDRKAAACCCHFDGRLEHYYTLADRGPAEGVVRARRQQFVRAYPELGLRFTEHLRDIKSGTDPLNVAHGPFLSALVEHVDGARPLHALIRSYLGLDRWVQSTTRGRFSLTSTIGRLFVQHGKMGPPRGADALPVELGGYTIMSKLQSLGPGWRLRNDDMTRAFFLLEAFHNGVGAAAGGGWSPVTTEGWRKTFKALPGRISPWKELERALYQAAHPHPDLERGTRADLPLVIASIRDACYSIHQYIMHPLNMLANHLQTRIEHGDDFQDIGMRDVEKAQEGGERTLILEACKQICPSYEIMGEPSIQRVAAISEKWHRQQDAIMAARSIGLPRRDRLPDGLSLSEWDALIPPMTVQGVHIVPLTTAASLAAHGRNMRHCVGHYDQICLTGQSHILRLTSEDDGESTAELRIAADGRLIEVQHRAVENSAPSDCHVQALRALLARLNHHLASDSGHTEACPLSRQWATTLLERGKRRASFLGRSVSQWSYDDPVAVDAIINAYRFVLNSQLRRRWEVGTTPEERVRAAAQWVLEKRIQRTRAWNANTMRAADGPVLAA